MWVYGRQAFRVGLVAGSLFLATCGISLSGRRARQKEARKDDPPDDCRPGQRWVKMTELGALPGEWEVTALHAQFSHVTSQTKGRRHDAGREIVRELNRAIQMRRETRSDAATLYPASLPSALELAAQIVDWQASEEKAHDVTLEASLEGGEVAVQFEEFRCKRDRWVKVREWEGRVSATQRQAGLVWGPKSGEGHANYVARVKIDVGDRLRDLVEAVARI